MDLLSNRMSAKLNPQEQKCIDFTKDVKIKFYLPKNANTSIENSGVLTKQTAVALNIEFDCPGVLTGSDRIYELVFDNASTAEEFIRGIYFAVKASKGDLEPELFDNKVRNTLL